MRVMRLVKVWQKEIGYGSSQKISKKTDSKENR